MAPQPWKAGGDDTEGYLRLKGSKALNPRSLAALRELHVIYPNYGFDQHKGYPTALHLERLQLHGVSPVHRKSYAPVRAILDRADPA